ncbi:hypothetical protein BABINDRAFT_162285 [Babjeviella inositovora NRRL Y-12698]|uniref:candidapepsin n=1 Tax=Babjeviella inositovora NRRL Y-12698 TaxID=984486 RepID=A0A1E3QNN5_9ASCO|nr:uncharacterized protein BABINDRAFT_162285 [Babjeviella inositovora NRRL Y-12698]ODQ79250.1 hypothetical protein BABINDRAFT_162285 [Babjeviella inositovora NRRL Y-12698]
MDFNIHRGSSVNSAEHGASIQLSKREVNGLVTMKLVNENTFYLANLSVGSNSQNMGVLVDTGSSDLWVIGSDNSYCTGGIAKRDTSDDVDCSVYGTFDKSTSTSFKSNNTVFTTLYTDEMTASGEWGYDTVSIGSLTVENMSIAVANMTDSSMGVLGIGLPGMETTYTSMSEEDAHMYENFPMKLKSEGIIMKNIYSLYLNQESASYGTVLFGGVDHSKYIDRLITVPIINSYPDYLDNPVLIQVAYDSISFEGKTLLHASDTAILDSGSTISYLPSAVVNAAVSAMGMRYHKNIGAYAASCNSFKDKSFNFTFDGADITVPASNFLINFAGIPSSICGLGMMESDQTVFGDNFLRAAYVVYDLDDYEVSLANANFGESSNDEDVVAVVSTIPNARFGASTGTSNTATTTRAGRASTSRSSSTKFSSLRNSGAGHIAFPEVLTIMGSVFCSALLLIL